MTDTIQHATFCTIQPGETAPRIETFRRERTDHAGVIIGRPLIQRCMDCGEQTVDGQPVQV